MSAFKIRANPHSLEQTVELARYKAPPETRRILMLNNIITSDGNLPRGVESVEVTTESIRLIKEKKLRVID